MDARAQPESQVGEKACLGFKLSWGVRWAAMLMELKIRHPLHQPQSQDARLEIKGCGTVWQVQVQKQKASVTADGARRMLMATLLGRKI